MVLPKKISIFFFKRLGTIAVTILFLYYFFYIYFHYTLRNNNTTSTIELKELNNQTQENNKATGPTIFCLIKTHPDNIKINKTLNTFRVWGHKCDNYRFVTLIPKEFISKDIDTTKTFEVFNQFYMIQPEGLTDETHGNLSLKLYYSMIHVYKKFPRYDWYHIVDDDAYVNIKNFKKFLLDKNPLEPVTYGYNFKVIVKDGYHSGGPGYALSNEAFTRVCKFLIENIRNCPNTGTDDVDINACVRKYGGYMGKSTDENGRERFFPLSFMSYYLGYFPDWLKSYAENPLRNGTDCCADTFIACHYMSPRDLFRLDLAFELHESAIKLYNQNIQLEKPIKFKNIIKNYVLLEDIEFDTNKFHDLITSK